MNFSSVFSDIHELNEEIEELNRLCNHERRVVAIDLAHRYDEDFFTNNISYTAVKKRRAARKKKIARKSELPIFGIKIQESL